MTKTLRVDLADLEGIPHASGASGTSVTVTAEYTSPVIRESDGTIILAPKSKTMGSSGRVDFTGIYTSDSPDVREDHRGFAVRVKAEVRIPNGGTWTWARTVKPLEHMADTIRLGRMPSAEGLPPKWATVGEVLNDVTAVYATVDNLSATATELPPGAPPTVTVSGPIPNKVINIGVPRGADGEPGMGYEEGQQLLADSQAAQTSAASSASDAADAVTLAQQAQAAALEVPDANMAAAIGNDSTQTAQAGDSRWLKGTRDANNTIRALTNTNDNSTGVAQCIFIAAPSSTSPHTINGSTALLRLVLGGYDSTMGDALAATMIQGMHAEIDEGSTHGLIVGGSYQQLIDSDYATAIGGTGLTVGGDGVQSNYSVALGGHTNTVRGYHAAAIGGTQNNLRARAAGAVGGEANASYGEYSLIAGRENTLGSSTNPTWGQYAAIVGGYQNNLGTTANGQFAAVVGGRGHDVQAEYAGVVGGYGAKPRFGGAQAWAMGYANEVGDAQMERAVFWGVSTTTGVKQLLVNNTERLVLPDNTTWGFEGFVTGRRASDGETGVWKVTGAISRGSGVGSTVILGEPTVEPVGTTTGGAEAWSITAVADNTWGALALRGRSPSGGTVNWSAGIDLTEVTA